MATKFSWTHGEWCDRNDPEGYECWMEADGVSYEARVASTDGEWSWVVFASGKSEDGSWREIQDAGFEPKVTPAKRSCERAMRKAMSDVRERVATERPPGLVRVGCLDVVPGE